MNKKFINLFILLLCITGLFSISGCQASKPETTVVNEVYDNNFNTLPLGVGILTDSQGQQAGLTDTVNRVADEIENQLGLNTVVLDLAETATPNDALSYLSDQGLRLIYILGGEDQVAKIAKRYPNITYICVGFEGPSQKNVKSIRYRLEEPAYLGGVLAATLTKSEQVGFVAGSENEQTRQELAAYIKGVESIAKAEERKITVTKAYIDVTNAGFHKLDKAESKTLELIDKGADFIYSDSGSANAGVTRALSQREAFGTLVDVQPQIHAKIKNTFILSVERSMFEIARAYIKPNKDTAIPTVGLKEKGIEISAFGLDRSSYDEAIINRLAYVRDEIVAGRIKL